MLYSDFGTRLEHEQDVIYNLYLAGDFRDSCFTSFGINNKKSIANSHSLEYGLGINGPIIFPGISTPAGFTTDQCKFIIGVDEIRCPKEYTLRDVKTGYEILGPNLFNVYALGYCRINDDQLAIPEIQKANYVVICQK